MENSIVFHPKNGISFSMKTEVGITRRVEFSAKKLRFSGVKGDAGGGAKLAMDQLRADEDMNKNRRMLKERTDIV